MGNEPSHTSRGNRRALRTALLAACQHDDAFMSHGERHVILPHLFRPPPADTSAQQTSVEEQQASSEASPSGGDGAAQQPTEMQEAAKIEEVAATSALLTWDGIAAILRTKITSVAQLQDALEKISRDNVSCKYFEEHYSGRDAEATAYFFDTLLPFIQNLALRLPELFPEDQPLPVLQRNTDSEVTLTQEQVACILASTFMRTLWIKPAWFGDGTLYPDLDFESLFCNPRGPCRSVLDCILHYFKRVSEHMPDGKVTFRRQVLKYEEIPDWENSTKPICPIQVFDKGTIEDSTAHLHGDFANEYIGGGVLSGGCVQEEILFAIKPECLASMLFCPKMEDDEVIFITGAERFSSYRGYGHRFEWGGNFDDATPRDALGRRDVIIVAMDAIVAGGRNQFTRRLMERDTNKAYNAFREPSSTQPMRAVATGNWGCGAFGGDKSLKVMQQILAASEAGRPLQYFTFGEKYNNRSLKDSIERVAAGAAARSLTVGQLFKVLLAALGKSKPDFFELFDRLYPPLQAGESVAAPASASSASTPAAATAGHATAAGEESQGTESQGDSKAGHD